MSRNVYYTVPSDVLSLHALTLRSTVTLSFQYKCQAARCNVYIMEWATPSLTVWFGTRFPVQKLIESNLFGWCLSPLAAVCTLVVCVIVIPNYLYGTRVYVCRPPGTVDGIWVHALRRLGCSAPVQRPVFWHNPEDPAHTGTQRQMQYRKIIIIAFSENIFANTYKRCPDTVAYDNIQTDGQMDRPRCGEVCWH